MYGTIARLRIKPGMEETAQAEMARQETRQSPAGSPRMSTRWTATPASSSWSCCSRARRPMSPTRGPAPARGISNPDELPRRRARMERRGGRRDAGHAPGAVGGLPLPSEEGDTEPRPLLHWGTARAVPQNRIPMPLRRRNRLQVVVHGEQLPPLPLIVEHRDGASSVGCAYCVRARCSALQSCACQNLAMDAAIAPHTACTMTTAGRLDHPVPQHDATDGDGSHRRVEMLEG